MSARSRIAGGAQLALALLASLAAACARGSDAANATGAPDRLLSEAAVGTAALAPRDEDVLAKMPDAPFTTRYAGVRRVHMQLTVGGETGAVTYREDVASDGAGRFQVRPIDVEGAGLTDADRERFLAMQERRAGFAYRHRDFRVRDWTLFRESHALAVESDDETVAGVSCFRIRVQRREHAKLYYRAWVDPRSGLVLAWEQRALDGLLLAEARFETIDFAPDLSAVTLRGELFDEAPIDLARTSVRDAVDFPLLEPQILPSGYRLTSASTFTDAAGRRWVRRHYGDGCDVVVFLQGAPEGSGPAPSYVDLFEAGAWVLLQGVIERSDVIVMGRTGADELRQLLQSARIF